MRVPFRQKARLRLAADLSHTKMSTFVLGAAEEKADKVIAEHATTWVPADFFDTFYGSLDAPVRPNPDLAASAMRPSPVSQR